MYGDGGVDRRRNTVGVCRPTIDEDRKNDRNAELQRRRATKSLSAYFEVKPMLQGPNESIQIRFCNKTKDKAMTDLPVLISRVTRLATTNLDRSNIFCEIKIYRETKQIG